MTESGVATTGREGSPLLVGRGGSWPFAGYVRGWLPEARAGGCRVSWAGRVGGGDDPEVGWRAARAVARSLERKGPVEADRRRALSILWARLDGVRREVLGEAQGLDLTLLLVAADPEGAAVTGVGLGEVWALERAGRAAPWVVGEHPLLSAPGLPRERPGAVDVERLPRWLVGVATGEGPLPAGLGADQILPACGVRT